MKNFIIQFGTYLQGKKTYIVGSLMILLGYMTNNNEMILQGLGLITLRMGINNNNNK